MAQLSKYVEERFAAAVRKLKKRFPFMKYRLITARAVKMLKEEEARLKDLAKDKG